MRLLSSLHQNTTPLAVLRARLVKDGKLAEQRADVDGRTAYRLSLPAKARTRATTRAAGKRKVKARRLPA